MSGDDNVRRDRARRLAATVVALALSASTAAGATGLAQLKAFVDGAKNGRTAFTQSVLAKGAREPQVSSGTFTFARPGRFRWSYEVPYAQLIVGDGSRLWIYDRDLNQVITRTQDAMLGASPAALLSGDNALDRNFDIVDMGRNDGLELVEARPRAPESGVERVRIGFRDNLPRMMELHDTFGNVTTLTFDSFQRNVVLDPAQFTFMPPKGADVVGE
jgi:outer membrane lipoprotein carrier protein